MNKFNCNGCGACCKLVGYSVIHARNLPQGERTQLTEEVASFPYNFNELGHCEHLLEDNSCAVYEDRPSICRVDMTFEKYYADKKTFDEYATESESACRELEKIVKGLEENSSDT